MLPATASWRTDTTASAGVVVVLVVARRVVRSLARRPGRRFEGASVASSNESKDTMVGYLRRTGPAEAELFDKDSGQVFKLNTATFADGSFLMLDGREWMDWIFNHGPGDEHGTA